MHSGIPPPPTGTRQASRGQVSPLGPGRHPPKTRHPQDQAPPDQAPPVTRQAPPDQAPPRTRQTSQDQTGLQELGTPSPGPGTPPSPSRAYWEIRSTSGRYASYWNTILLLIAFVGICLIVISKWPPLFHRLLWFWCIERSDGSVNLL